MNIIITGASSGIGFEAALEWIRDAKNTVVAIARNIDKLKRLHQIAKDLNPDCKLIPVQFDIVNGDYEQGLIPFLNLKLEGKIDVLVNNAGELVNKPFMELTDADWYQMLDSNVMGHVRMCKNLIPLMNEQSHILNISTMGAFQGSAKFAGLSAYSASKAALCTLTEVLATELLDKKIACNCLALGSAQTEMLEKSLPGYQSPIMAFEMGKYVAVFAITGHKFFNGKIIPVALLSV